jgi:hypothetical protein
MEKGVWLDYDYNSISLENNEKVPIRKKGYGSNIELCIYNDMFKRFDDADGDDFFCSPMDVDKILIIPDID